MVEAPSPTQVIHHWRWLAVLLTGFVLWVLSVQLTALTQNPNLIPTVVLLGSFLVPVTAVIWYLDHEPSVTITAQRLVFAFIYGGVLGILTAALLEAWLLQDGPLVYVGVGLIEEFAKIAALVLVSFGIRRFTMRDGIVLGAAVGFGFAALESSGYAFSALFSPRGLSLTNLVFSEILRGVLAPVGHGLWTAILGGVLFDAASRKGRLGLSWRFIRTYLVVSLLHALWDSMRGIAIFLTALLSPVPIAFSTLFLGVMPRAGTVVGVLFVVFEFSGLAIISFIGLVMLRGAWRRAHRQIDGPGLEPGTYSGRLA